MRRLARNLYRLHLFGWQGALSLAFLTPPLALALLTPWLAGAAWDALKTVFLLDLVSYVCFAIPLWLLSWLPIEMRQVDEALDAA